MVWPTRNEDWAADAAELHLANGGRRLVYVGEPPGGRTGDLRLHAALGLLGVSNAPCTCGVARTWRLLDRATLPRWEDTEAELLVVGPPEGPPSRRPFAWRPHR